MGQIWKRPLKADPSARRSELSFLFLSFFTVHISFFPDCWVNGNDSEGLSANPRDKTRRYEARNLDAMAVVVVDFGADRETLTLA